MSHHFSMQQFLNNLDIYAVVFSILLLILISIKVITVMYVCIYYPIAWKLQGYAQICTRSQGSLRESYY